MPTSHTYIYIYTKTNTYIWRASMLQRKKTVLFALLEQFNTLCLFFFFSFCFFKNIYMLSTFVCHDSVYPKAYMKPSSSFSVLCFLNHCISIYISVNTVCSWKFSSFCSLQQFHLISAWFLHVHIALFAFHCTREIFSRGFFSIDFPQIFVTINFSSSMKSFSSMLLFHINKFELDKCESDDGAGDILSILRPFITSINIFFRTI